MDTLQGKGALRSLLLHEDRTIDINEMMTWALGEVRGGGIEKARICVLTAIEENSEGERDARAVRYN